MLAGRRVLIDASMVTQGGGYTYLVNMVPLLAAAAPKATFLVLVRSPSLIRAIAPAENVEIRALPVRGLLGRFAFLVFSSAKLTKDWGADVYFSVAEYAPRASSCPVVVSLRNANIFTTLDLGWGPYQKTRLRLLGYLARAAVKSASRVIFVSRDSAAWMGDAAKVVPDKRVVIHHGADVERWREEIAREPRRGSVGILTLSSVYRYKNCVRLVEAYCELARRVPDLPPLTIVGDDQDSRHSEHLRQALLKAGSLAERIRWVGAVPYEEVVAYYRDAVLFVFPSYLETFGHPLLEAMAAELPVVAADIPVFREIARDSAVYVDPFDVKAMADGIGEVLANPELARQLVDSAHVRARDFTWEITADRLIAVLEDVIHQG